MRTQIIINHKPTGSLSPIPVSPILQPGPYIPISGPISANNYSVRTPFNPNSFYFNTLSILKSIMQFKSVDLDLFEDTEIPMNYTIADIRDPDKRKTTFSKTIVLPGTKNNNKIFNHIYEIGIDSKFNPNRRTEVVILQDGVGVMHGNMQLKRINRYHDKDVEYEVLITGDFTSLFADIGISKISDLDFSEYSHTWNRQSIENSWNGIIKKGGNNYSNVIIGPQRDFTQIDREASTGRVMITTSTPHALNEEDWVRIFPDENNSTAQLWPLIKGEYCVAEIINANTFTVNYQFPDPLLNNSLGGYIRRWEVKGEGYVYPMISWGDDLSPAQFPVTSYVMSFYVKDIWDRIFKETGSRYESQFLNSQFFKRLVMPQKKKEYGLPASEFEGRKFKVANETQPEIQIAGFAANSGGSLNGAWRSIPYNTTNMIPYPFTASIANSDGLLYNGTPGNEPFDKTLNKWIVTDSGKYSLSFEIALDSTVRISDYRADGSFYPPEDEPDLRYYFGGWPAASYEEDLKVRLELKRRSGNVTSTINSVVESLWTPYTSFIKDTFRDWRSPVKVLSVNFAAANGEPLFLNKDDELWVEVSYFGDFNNNTVGLFTEYYDQGINESPRYEITGYRGEARVRVRGVQIFQNNPSPIVDENSEVFPEQFLPNDMTCRDFLISIIRAFNLYVENDNEIQNLYRIEPRDSYYRDGSGGLGDYVDWTDKVDLDSMQILPMGELTAKFYNFEYKPENDYWNKKYREDVGIGYSDYSKEIQNDFLNNISTIGLQFGASVMINNPADSSIVIPQIVQRDDGVNKMTSSAPKLLIWSGPKPTTRRSGGIFKWKLIEQQASGTGIVEYTSYPYAGTVDSPLDPIYDLSWFYTKYVYWNNARWTNNNLYNRYWRNFIEEITDKDSKLIKAWIKLTPKDIYNLDFKKIYVINGHYLRLQKIIDYNANGEGLTQCELLKLKSVSKFKRRSILIDEAFTDVKDISRPVTTGVIERPPITFVGRTPLGNVMPSSNGGNVTTSINGNSNVICDGTKNVIIQGDENFIGPKSTNISINGSGVFVSGGVNNVNVIGTNKIFINESDVTYINGIRYKWGIPISRSGVIDAGVNTALKKNPANTIANVIDACEDVDMNWGSNSNENVIDAGLDRILNDISDYGLTTFNTPNQSTNFAGPVGQNFNIISLREIILERVDPRPYEEQ